MTIPFDAPCENSAAYRAPQDSILTRRATLGVKAAASTVRKILKDAGIDPAPQRTSTTWASFLRSQADAILACDFFETANLTGQRLYALAVIEHTTRRIRILGATAHPIAEWVTQAARKCGNPASEVSVSDIRPALDTPLSSDVVCGHKDQAES